MLQESRCAAADLGQPVDVLHDVESLHGCALCMLLGRCMAAAAVPIGVRLKCNVHAGKLNSQRLQCDHLHVILS